MNVNALLTNDIPSHNGSSHLPSVYTTPQNGASTMTPKSLSPNYDCKAVSFRLRDSDAEPKKFYIRPNDSTNEIMDAVKHLFGVARQHHLGISLEGPDGLSFIPSHENFEDGTTVYVRIEEPAISKHQYNLRQSNPFNPTPIMNGAAAGFGYPMGRSESPPAFHGRRSASSSVNGRTRSLKRNAQSLDMTLPGDYHPEEMHGQFYALPSQQFLPDEEDSDGRSRPGVASSDISLDNIVEGSRRKRPKFSSDELPLFPPPALPRPDCSPASASPTRQPQILTPYSHHSQRAFTFSHPTPPSLNGFGGYSQTSGPQSRNLSSIVVPTPAPTVASCISDEDVAMQLMRLGTVNNGSATASSHDDIRDDAGFSSEGGEFGDEGRSDTTELPDPLPPQNAGGLPDSPILYPRPIRNKTLDEILPSFDTTEPSDDENQPPVSNTTMHPRRARGPQSDDEDEGDGLDDERDGTYVGQENEDDADYEDELDDVPLKARRDRVLSDAVNPPTNLGRQPLKIATKVAKKCPTLPSNPRPIIQTAVEPTYPISPASPPASRKPSVASSISAGNKPRPVNVNVNGHSIMNQSTQPEYAMISPTQDQPLVDPTLKPRCQRCRKSKKGCDRQRPCQRCKDAGIPADGCISEDEAGTRRGRQAAAAAKKAGVSGSKSKKKKKV